MASDPPKLVRSTSATSSLEMEKDVKMAQKWVDSDRNEVQFELTAELNERRIVILCPTVESPGKDGGSRFSITLDKPYAIVALDKALRDLEDASAEFCFGGKKRSIINVVSFAAQYVGKLWEADEDAWDREEPERGAGGDDDDEPEPVADDYDYDYKTIEKAEVSEMQRDLITALAARLSVSLGAAGILLRHYKWNKSKLIKEYKAKPTAVAREVGCVSVLHGVQTSVSNPDAMFTCECCFSDHKMENSFALKCGHRLCTPCWKGFLETQVNVGTAAGTNCLFSTCPGYNCKEVLGEEVYEYLCDDDLVNKYRQFLLNSFVDESENMKWCPAPGCEKVVAMGRGKRTVRCACGYKFCFRCKEEAHFPSTCDQATNWKQRDKGSASLDVKYIMEQTKPCPHCVCEGTLVSLANGTSVPIETLKDNTIPVLTYDSEQGRIIAAQQTAWYSQGEKPCVQLTLSDGRTLTCTDDHLIHTLNRGDVKAGELNLNDDQIICGGDQPQVKPSSLGEADKPNQKMYGGVAHEKMVLPTYLLTLVDRCDVGTKRVYDISVPATELFIANGIVIHNCGVRTNKNGGCMYMNCAQCKKPWCWQCGKSDHHVWECNRPAYEMKEVKEGDDMNRYLFYFERYFNHNESRKIAEKQRIATQAKIKEMVSQGMHLKGVDFLSDAVDLIIECRRVLKWTYVKGFSINPKNEKELKLFEFRQSELEKYTEQLNQLTEKSAEDLEKNRKNVINWTEALHKYLKGMEEDVKEGAAAEEDKSSTGDTDTPTSPKKKEEPKAPAKGAAAKAAAAAGGKDAPKVEEKDKPKKEAKLVDKTSFFSFLRNKKEKGKVEAGGAAAAAGGGATAAVANGTTTATTTVAGKPAALVVGAAKLGVPGGRFAPKPKAAAAAGGTPAKK